MSTMVPPRTGTKLTEQSNIILSHLAAKIIYYTAGLLNKTLIVFRRPYCLNEGIDIMTMRINEDRDFLE